MKSDGTISDGLVASVSTLPPKETMDRLAAAVGQRGRLGAAHQVDDDPFAVGGRARARDRDHREPPRVIRADDGSVRQLRAYAEPLADPAGTVVAVRGAYQDVSADYHTRLAFEAAREQLADTEEWAQEEHKLAIRLQEAITPRSAKPVNILERAEETHRSPADRA